MQKSADADAFVFVAVEALGVGQAGAGRKAGANLDLISLTLKFFCRMKRQYFRAGCVVGLEYMCGK